MNHLYFIKLRKDINNPQIPVPFRLAAEPNALLGSHPCLVFNRNGVPIPPATIASCCEVWPFPIHGRGVFATRAIPPYTLISMYPIDFITLKQPRPEMRLNWCPAAPGELAFSAVFDEFGDATSAGERDQELRAYSRSIPIDVVFGDSGMEIETRIYGDPRYH